MGFLDIPSNLAVKLIDLICKLIKYVTK